MSVLLDEETITIDHLDFTIACEVHNPSGQCEEEADFQMECVGCGGPCGLLCLNHAIYARTSDRPVRHAACGLSGPLREMVTVFPLGGAL